MTKLLQEVIDKLECLSEDDQQAIATRWLAELEDEQKWQVKFDATTDEQWDNLAAMVRQEIVEGDVIPLIDIFASQF